MAGFRQDTPGVDRETKPTEGSPHGWIQWKGTQVCMDIRCPCGKLGHVDDEFAYWIRCSDCGRTYWVNPHVELVPLTDEEAASLQGDGRVVPTREDC